MVPQAWLLEAADNQLTPGCRAHALPWDGELCAEQGSVGGTGSGVWPVHPEQNRGWSPHTPASPVLHEHQGAGALVFRGSLRERHWVPGPPCQGSVG